MRTVPRNAVRLEVHICDERRSYFVDFMEGSDEAATRYVLARLDTCDMGPAREDEENPNWAFFPKMMEALNPTCQHGLSLELCEGPNHYMTYDQERARYGDW